MVKISVIIPCYNQEKYIADCLNSVLKQTFDDYEAIVIDDGSTDNSINIIKEYQKNSDKIYLIQQTNQGVIAARNNAIKHSNGEYIYTLDGDDVIHEDVLKKSFEAIESKKGDIISTQYKTFVSDTSNGHEIISFMKPSKINMIIKNCICNSALFRKSDFDKCGGYDPTFAKGYEDYDLWLNMILRHNLKIYRIPEYLFFYRTKDISESRDKQANKNHNKLTLLLLKKYPELIIGKLIRFFYQKKITLSNKLIIKIFKITVFSKKLK